MNEAAVKKHMTDFDANGDGVLQYEEFKQLMFKLFPKWYSLLN